MTYDEGLSVLGVSDTASHKEVRRAYLRLVKQHKPERDPEGFKRVRAAYETVKVLAEAREELPEGLLDTLQVTSAANAEGDEAAIVTSITNLEDEPEEPSPELSAAAENSSTTGVERYFDEVEDLGDSADAAALVEIWLRAVEDLPDEPAPRWQLVDAFEDLGDSERAAQVLIDATQRRLPGFVETLLWRYPTHIPRDLIDEVAKDPSLRGMVADALLENSRPKHAGRILQLSLDDALADPAAPEPPVETTVRTVAWLVAKGARRQANELSRRLEAWLEHSQRGHQALQGEAAARWLLIQELLGVSQLPLEVAQPIAHAIATDDADHVAEELSEFRQFDPDEAAKARAWLKKRAPAVFAGFGEYLEKPSIFEDTSTGTGSTGSTLGGWGLWLSLILALGAVKSLVRTCTDTTDTTEPTPYTYETRNPPEPAASVPPPALPPDSAPAAPANLAVVQDAADNIRFRAVDLELTELPGLVLNTTAAFHKDCDELVEQFSRLENATKVEHTGDTYMRNQVQVIWAEVMIQCPGKLKIE